MANLSTYAANKLLDALLRNVPYTSTATYVALYTTDPTEPGATGGVEVSGGSYVRERLDTVLAAAVSGSSTTNAQITWPQATADWGTIVGLGICDAPTLGNVLASGPLTQSKQVLNGDTFVIPVGDLTTAIS